MLPSPFQNIRPTLREFRLFESDDIDDTRDRIAGVLQEHRLIPGRRARDVRSHMDFLALEHIGIGTLRYGSPMKVEVTGLDDYHVMIFCLNGTGIVRAGKLEAAVNTRWGFMATAGEAFRARFSSDCEQLVIRLRRDCLPRACTASLGKASIDLTDTRNSRWIEFLRSLASTKESTSPGRPASRFEHLFVDSLLESRTERSREVRLNHEISPYSVHKAERFIAANYFRPITLKNIAVSSGVHERTLHLAFNRFRNTTPMMFLRNFRLDRARERLLSLEAGTVGSVARACGFSHLGRFSKDYAIRFGKTPSATVRAIKR